MNEFKDDIVDLFSMKRGGHVQKWLYTDSLRPDNRSGASLWHNFVNTNKKYYIIREEIRIIPEIINKIDKNYDTVVEFGIGDKISTEQKTLPLLKSLPDLKKYYAIDVSTENISSGFEILNKETNHIKTISIVNDFYADNNEIEGENRLGLCLGATISNQEMRIGREFPRERIINQLKTLGKTVKGNKRGNILLSIDANPNLDGALAAYQHPSWINMMTGLMYDVKELLKPKGDFNPSLWHYSPVIDREHHVIHQAISPSSNQYFSIDEHEFRIKEGEHFVVKNNFKYPYDVFIELSKQAGLTPQDNSETPRRFNVVILNAEA